MSMHRVALGLALVTLLSSGLTACRAPTPTPVPATPSPAVVADVQVSPTARPSATRTPESEPATGVPTAGSTPTGALARVVGTLWAAQTELPAGSCTEMRWNVPGGREVVLDGRSESANGTRQICPAETETHVLAWTNPDGSHGAARLTLAVVAPTAPPKAEEPKRDAERKPLGPSPVPATSTPAPPPTATDCGDECDPWSPPWPTDTPEPQPTAGEPTEAPTTEPPGTP